MIINDDELENFVMPEATLKEVAQLAEQLSVNEQLNLVSQITQRLHLISSRVPPKDLRGIWKGKFPENFDVDAALHEVRDSWKTDFPELKK